MEKKNLHAVDLSGATWWKAQASQGADQSCVEITRIAVDGAVAGMAVRDSKDPNSPVLRFTLQEWTAFLDGANNGEMNL